MLSGETTAPSLLSEADLLSMMARNEIGTDATMAEHIKKIQERNYVIKTPERFLVPTNLGISLVDGYSAIRYNLRS